MSNDLIDLMREYGIEVQMLGTDESPSPAEVALAHMLTEIHTLRSRNAAERQPVPVSDEELDAIFWKHHMSHLQGTTDTMPHLPPEYRGVRAVRAALGPAVPVIPEGWWSVELTKSLLSVDEQDWREEDERIPLGHIKAEVWMQDDQESVFFGVGSTWLDALTAAIAAIAAAKENDHD